LPLIGGKPYVNSVFAQDAGPLGQFLYDFRAMTWWTAVTEVALAVNDRRLFKSPYPLFSSAPRGFVEGRCVLRGIPVDTMRVRK